MDDKDKTVIEQIVDKVNDFVEHIAVTASDALQSQMSNQSPMMPPKAMMLAYALRKKRTKKAAKRRYIKNS